MENLHQALTDRQSKRVKHYYVNVLVGTYFLYRPEGTDVVHHKNGNKLDNREENLEWVTQGKNMEEWWKMRKEAGYAQRKRSEKKKLSDKEIEEKYVSIGVIKGWDFSEYFIHKDGSKILGKDKKEMEIDFRNGYGKIQLYDMNKEGHKLRVHKIINQVLKGGIYEDEIDHVDGIKENNEKDNLEPVTRKENVTRATGKAVNQIDVITGNVINTFPCVKDACRKLGKKLCNNIHIGQVCKGERKTACGYRWEWC
jgi:hypothetical protein